MKHFNIFGVHLKIRFLEGGGGAWQERGEVLFKWRIYSPMHTMHRIVRKKM